jgi:hypothetical protein
MAWYRWRWIGAPLMIVPMFGCLLSLFAVRLGLSDPLFAVWWSTAIVFFSGVSCAGKLCQTDGCVEGMVALLPVDDRRVFWRCCRDQLKAIGLSIVLIVVTACAFCFAAGMTAWQGVIVSMSLISWQISFLLLLMVIPISKVWHTRLELFRSVRLFLGVFAFLIVTLFLKNELVERFSAGAVVISMLFPPSWPMLTISKCPTETSVVVAGLILAAVAAVTLAIQRMRWLAQRFSIHEVLIVGAKPTWLCLTFATKSTKALPSHESPHDTFVEAWKEPEDYHDTFQAWYEYHETVRANARYWYQRLGMSSHELQLVEWRLGDAVKALEPEKLLGWNCVIVLLAAFIPLDAAVWIGVLGLVWFQLKNFDLVVSDYRRIHTLPINSQEVLLADLKYRFLRLLPWALIAIQAAAIWSVRNGLPVLEFATYALKAGLAVSLYITIATLLAYIANLDVYFGSWRGIKRLGGLLLCLAGILPFGVFGLLDQSIWSWFAGLVCLVSTVFLFWQCRNFVRSGSDLKRQ